MSDVTADEAETEEALAEFNFLMPDGTDKVLKVGAADGEGTLLVKSHHIQSVLKMQPVATDRVAWSVCLLVMIMSYGEMAEAIEITIGE